jgi:hypothetical protein
MLILLALLGGCGSPPQGNTQTSPTGSTLPFTILPNLFAAPSLVDLQGSIFGLGSDPNIYDCQKEPVLARECWLDIKDPGSALLIGALVEVPCAESSFSATLSARDEITIAVMDRASPYPPGFIPSGGPSPKPGACAKGVTPAWMLSLLAIPFSALPADELTIKVAHPGLDIPSSKTMVDLKRPLNISTDLTARIAEVRSAINLAFQDATTRVTPGQSVGAVALGTQRWPDTALGCPVAGQQYAAIVSMGYLVLLEGSDQPSLLMEYHASGNTLRFCGRTAGWNPS